MAVRTWRTAAALAIVALFFASGTVIASERPAQAAFTNYQGAFVGCLSASPPEGFTDPGGWRQVIAVSPAAGHLVLVLVSSSSDLRLCSSGASVSGQTYCPAGGFDMRFLGCTSFTPGPESLVFSGGAAPEVGALALLLPDGTVLDAVVAGGAFVVAEQRTVTDEPEALRLRVSDHVGGRLYEGPMFRPPGTR